MTFSPLNRPSFHFFPTREGVWALPCPFLSGAGVASFPLQNTLHLPTLFCVKHRSLAAPVSGVVASGIEGVCTAACLLVGVRPSIGLRLHPKVPPSHICASGWPPWVQGQHHLPLTLEAQRLIHAHQNPPVCDCRRQKFMFFRMLNQGLGAEIHLLSWALGLAMTENVILHTTDAEWVCPLPLAQAQSHPSLAGRSHGVMHLTHEPGETGFSTWRGGAVSRAPKKLEGGGFGRRAQLTGPLISYYELTRRNFF